MADLGIGSLKEATLKEFQRFVSKDSTVEAIQWTGDNWKDIKASMGGGPMIGTARFTGERPDLEIWVEKSKAWCVLKPGDWIVREPDGEGNYPCAAKPFAAKYEPKGAE